MATERKKMKRKSVLKDELEKPTKEEYAVARCLKFSAPNRQGKFQGNSVDYFMGSKIVDFLLDSKWSSKKNAKSPLFTTRMSCVIYCARLLEKGFFHRVEKPERKAKKASDKLPSKDSTPQAQKEKKKALKVEEETEQQEENSEEKKKKRKPPKLRLHAVQQFIDGPDLYVWIYDPVPVKTFIIGLLLVVGVIGVCLFPLWPPEIKVGIYYLSCAAIGFIGVIFALCIIRVVVFVAVWLATLGKISLWLLPNLTEDVGFFDSFKPLYKLQSQADAGPGPLVEKGKEKEKKEGQVTAADAVKSGGGGEVLLVGEGGDADVKGTDVKEDGEEEEEDDDKNTNSTNGYEIVDPEDYEMEGQLKDEGDDDDGNGDDNDNDAEEEDEEDDDDNEEEEEGGDDDDDDDDRDVKTKKTN